MALEHVLAFLFLLPSSAVLLFSVMHSLGMQAKRLLRGGCHHVALRVYTRNPDSEMAKRAAARVKHSKELQSAVVNARMWLSRETGPSPLLFSSLFLFFVGGGEVTVG